MQAETLAAQRQDDAPAFLYWNDFCLCHVKDIRGVNVAVVAFCRPRLRLFADLYIPSVHVLYEAIRRVQHTLIHHLTLFF